MALPVTIDLQQIDTKAFDNPIQAQAKEDLQKLIQEFLQAPEERKRYNKIDRVHNTILINGKRGMGKTSFMLSMENQKVFDNICHLGIIDPTLIETKEHVFLNIITKVRSEIEAQKSKNYSSLSNDLYRDWTQSLKSLAAGLSMLDGVGSNHLKDSMWDSPELILEKGLSNAMQGSMLENNFHIFIEESLKILKKEAFFLVFDDIDTSLDQGRDILETLRKYLTSSKLIIAMLGDIDLYSTLVRQLQWEKMDPNNTLMEYEGKDKYLDQIEHLEEQYLTKVLQPRNRIDLKSLMVLKDSIRIHGRHGVESLEVFINEMINKVYLTGGSSYLKYYQNTLLTQSTRSILQILHSWDKNENDFLTTVKHTFYTTIKKKLQSYNLVDSPLNGEFINLLSTYILKENINRDNHLKLIPEFTKEEENITVLYINAMANSIMKPQDYLSYFVKVGYTLEQFLNIKDKDEKELDTFINHIALDSGELSSKIAKRLLTLSNIHKTPILMGSIFISQHDLKLLQEKKNISLILSRVNVSNVGQYNFLSFFNLLGFLSDITRYPENIDEIIFSNTQILEFVLYKDTNMGGEVEGDEDSYPIQYELIEELRHWVLKAQSMQKIPLFLLAKIWVRMLYTFSNISKNKFDDYYQVLEMFTVGFLNAVYIEINLYNNNLGKSSIKNPERDPNVYYDKVEKYTKTHNTYTLFDYLNECPIFKNFEQYFSELKTLKIKVNQGKGSQKKADFKKILEEDRYRAEVLISEIKNWDVNTSGRTEQLLRKNFSNVPSLREIIKDMKNRL